MLKALILDSLILEFFQPRRLNGPDSFEERRMVLPAERSYREPQGASASIVSRMILVAIVLFKEGIVIHVDGHFNS